MANFASELAMVLRTDQALRTMVDDFCNSSATRAMSQEFKADSFKGYVEEWLENKHAGGVFLDTLAAKVVERLSGK